MICLRRSRNSAFRGLQAGDRWCLCAQRWQEALEANQAPRVVLRATHEGALSYCALADLKRSPWICPDSTPHLDFICGRMIQISGPLVCAIFDGMDVRDSRVHNYPPRWNAAPSQDLLVIRRNHQDRRRCRSILLRWGLYPVLVRGSEKAAASRSTPSAKP